MSLLERIASPADVRALADDALPTLCAELREAIVSTCGAVGGHLGASLGAVELIVALHRVFRTPVDRLVFDVGHQAYAHKLLTGRREQMGTLRQAGGLAPFLDPSESEHDAFGAGHASTAISVGVGLVEGLRLRQAPGQVVAIVGDGALTGGESFEGLNHAAVSGGRLIIVINDNGMSISANVGAVAGMLRRDARRFFESLGFTYAGPVDGHDVGALVALFRHAKDSSKPIVIHARTQKGRGFGPAESDVATRGHAMGPYELRDGKLVRGREGKTTWSEAVASLLESHLTSNPKAVVITPAMLEGSSLGPLAARFPERVFDVGIAEQHAVTFAAGLAKTGLQPIVCIYSTFLQRAVDQLIHDVVLPRLPVVFAVDRAGLVGADGATHQGVFDLSFSRSLPGLSITAPVFADDLPELLESAVERNAPAMIRFPRGVVTATRPVEVAAATRTRWLVSNDRAEAVFITHGPLGLVATEACSGNGFAALDVLDVNAIDRLMLRRAAESGALIVAEEVMPRGGLFGAVTELLALDGISCAVRHVSLPGDAVVRHGEAREQRRQLALSVEGLVSAAKSARRP